MFSIWLVVFFLFFVHFELENIQIFAKKIIWYTNSYLKKGTHLVRKKGDWKVAWLDLTKNMNNKMHVFFTNEGAFFSEKFSLTLLHEGLDVGFEIVGFELGLWDGRGVGVDVGAERKYKNKLPKLHILSTTKHVSVIGNFFVLKMFCVTNWFIFMDNAETM